MKKVLGTLIVLILFISGCNHDKGTFSNLKSMNYRMSDTDLSKIAGEKIYFGHQSVGYNIVNGINLLVNDSQKRLEVIEGFPDKNSKPGFYHSLNGKNCYPIGKIDDFVTKMEGGIGGNVDIAFFKFCYIDFSKETDVDQLFEHYKSSMARLKREFPGIKFIYCTAPLTRNSGWLKTLLKLLLHKGNSDKLDNLKRNEFNQLIHNEYDNKETIFDIAKFESNEYQTYFIKDGIKIYAMDADLTSDGGHLNTLGSEIVAKGLIELLVNMN